MDGHIHDAFFLIEKRKKEKRETVLRNAFLVFYKYNLEWRIFKSGGSFSVQTVSIIHVGSRVWIKGVNNFGMRWDWESLFLFFVRGQLHIYYCTVYWGRRGSGFFFWSAQMVQSKCSLFQIEAAKRIHQKSSSETFFQWWGMVLHQEGCIYF